MTEQIGNFIVKEYGTENNRIKIEAVSKDWNASWNQGTYVHGFIQRTMAEGEAEILEPFILANYLVGNVMLDSQGWNDLFTVFDEYATRAGVDLSPEEDEEIINEMKKVYEAQETANATENEATEDSSTKTD